MTTAGLQALLINACSAREECCTFPLILLQSLFSLFSYQNLGESVQTSQLWPLISKAIKGRAVFNGDISISYQHEYVS